jgi:hypothetical protein
MPKATHASVILARFDDLRQTGPIHPHPTALFQAAGADVRAGNSTAAAQQAFKFVIYGLHEGEADAQRAVANKHEIAPWLSEASEVWTGVLQPFRHYGEANFLGEAGPIYDVDQAPPDANTPIVILTSVGWNNPIDMDRVKRFSDGVAAVRIGMTGLHGLHSQQTFSFPGGLVQDGLTVTFWSSLASAMAFAYGPGFHRNQVKDHRESPDGDRTSFTRLTCLYQEGTWHGSDPLKSPL